MSRIAGLIAPSAQAQFEAWLLHLEASLAPAQWQRGVRTAANAVLMWAGWQSPRLHGEGEIVAVIDGVFFNADEFGVSSANAAEVIVRLYRRRGFRAAVQAINGDFAIALYDAVKGELWLARDRVGHRPLYYARSADCFGFASLPAALLALPKVSPAINRRFAAVFAGAHYRYIDNRPDESPYRDIAQLPASHLLCLRNGVVRIERYWDVAEQVELTATEGELAEQYRALLLDAVRRRMAALPDSGFTLSGGVDSSSVLSCAVEIAGCKLPAFSTVYSDKTYDESDDIRQFIDHKVSQWRPISIEDFDLFGTIENLIAAHQEPVATATWLSHYLLCKHAATDGVAGLFGGLGGDELNAGEYEYFLFHFADLKRAGRERELAHEVDLWAAYHDHPIFRKDRGVADEAIARLTDQRKAGHIRPDVARMARYFGAVSRDFYDLAGFAPMHDHPFTSALKNRTYQDIFRETAPCCLRAEDRNCGAFALEHADPFFDYRLIEFMFRVPGTMKIRDGVTKRLLREAMRGIVPEATRTRVKKTGWNAPAHLWFAQDGRNRLRDLIASRTFRERGIYNVAEVERLVAEHEQIVASGAARENHMMFLWQLVNLEAWFNYVDALSVWPTQAQGHQIVIA